MRLLITLLILPLFMTAQNTSELPYYEIPEAPESYNAGTVAARMVDGLGFRYYHATDGLTEKDLEFKPSEKGRTAFQTIEHIFNLSEMIVNTALQQATDFTTEPEELSFEDMRKQTLLNFKKASDALKDLENLDKNKLTFITGGGTRDYPFWNAINGPISDALWHCGQVVSFRRSSGNPFNSKASVLSGTVRD